VQFRIREQGGDWSYPHDWFGEYLSGQDFSKNVYVLTPGVIYEFQAGARNHGGKTWGETMQFITGPPVLSTCSGWSAGVQPNIGDLDTTFMFCVHYADPDGANPTVAKVVINGQPCDMTGGGNDTEYTAELLGSAFGYGTHGYYFYFEDAHGLAARLPADGEWAFLVTESGPCVGYPYAQLPRGQDGFGWSVAIDGEHAFVGTEYGPYMSAGGQNGPVMGR